MLFTKIIGQLGIHHSIYDLAVNTNTDLRILCLVGRRLIENKTERRRSL